MRLRPVPSTDIALVVASFIIVMVIVHTVAAPIVLILVVGAERR